MSTTATTVTISNHLKRMRNVDEGEEGETFTKRRRLDDDIPIGAAVGATSRKRCWNAMDEGHVLRRPHKRHCAEGAIFPLRTSRSLTGLQHLAKLAAMGNNEASMLRYMKENHVRFDFDEFNTYLGEQVLNARARRSVMVAVAVPPTDGDDDDPMQWD